MSLNKSFSIVSAGTLAVIFSLGIVVSAARPSAAEKQGAAGSLDTVHLLS